ncbi:hypothetical protein JK182_05025 [Acetobacter okinawensis]|uniref:hypothetical protein n=1 Tax=Acetobacter okinawensis TaxID=1076594 RepID=UPI001BA80499|nr:hypothetical protein [Acetobacter okinawensis]MBS0988041.1 hypothetical protein [Acetobacter okinawensis]
MTIEAYQVGVNLFANAERITGPIGEMISALERLLQAQKSAQSGFNDMTSALGGARRLARGMADDMERAARAAQNVASASSRFRPSGGGAYSGGGSSTPPVMPPIPPTQAWNGSYVSPYSAAATQVPGAPQLMLPAPEAASSPLLLGYDPRGETTVVRGSPQPMYGSSGPGVTVGSPYGPSASPPLLLEYQPTPRGPMNYANTYGPWKSVSDAPPAGSALRAVGEYASGLGMPRVGPFVGAAAAYAGWHGASETLGSAFRQTGAYDQTFLGMQGDPIAAAHMPAIRASAAQAMRDNPYLSPVDAARMAQEAYEVSGGQTAEQAPITSLINRVDRSFQLLGKNPEDAMRESIAFIRAQDISNRFYDPRTGQFSMEQASRSTDSALGMVIANRQFMRGQNFLTFSKSAGLAAQQMSDEGMLNLSHFIDVNPSRAGTQVRSLENLFGGTHARMTDKDFSYFRRLGMVGKNGQFLGQDQLRSDPIGWITHYLSPLLGSHPELLGRIQRMTVSDLVGETTGAEGNISRQAAAARRTDAARSTAALSGGQSAQSLAMHTAWERLEFTVGQAAQGSFISSLQALTGAFNGISDFVSKHPDDIRQFASDISALVRVTGSIAAGIGYVMNIVPGPIRRILESAAAGAATGAVGGSIIPGAGTAAGAVGGAVVGTIAGVANEGGHQARRVDAAVNRQPAQGSNSQPIQVTTQVMLDRRVLAEAVTMHALEQARQDMRASGTAPDLMQYAQYPGRSVGQ